MNIQLHAPRRRDWLQQYANAKSLQKKTFANICKFLQHLLARDVTGLYTSRAYFILVHMYERHNERNKPALTQLC